LRFTPDQRARLEAAHSGQRVGAELMEPQVQRHEDVFLAGKVVVQRRFGHPELLGDLPERCLVEALLNEEVECRIKNALTGALGLGCSRRRGVKRFGCRVNFLCHGSMLLDDR
jgi:hypothetical protein